MAMCPVCHIDDKNTTIPVNFPGDDFGNIKLVKCEKCGTFKVYASLFMSLLQDIDEYDVYKRSKISHWIRKNQRKDEYLFIDDLLIDRIIKSDLPKAIEQAENVILWLGELCKSPEETFEEKTENIASIIGAKDEEGVHYILNYLKNEGLISYSGYINNPVLGLKIEGWVKYDEIKSEGINVKKAFMAMKYGEDDLNNVYDTIFKIAVEKTGYELFLLNEKPSAGLIDNRMRVEIRNSRFLMADLTHGNPGAYWEAGFAEGLGKPVIYLCEKSVFDDKGKKPHFDVNHHQIIVWDKENLHKAEEDIKATIRNTLPLEAKMTDD